MRVRSAENAQKVRLKSILCTKTIKYICRVHLHFELFSNGRCLGTVIICTLLDYPINLTKWDSRHGINIYLCNIFSGQQRMRAKSLSFTVKVQNLRPGCIKRQSRDAIDDRRPKADYHLLVHISLFSPLLLFEMLVVNRPLPKCPLLSPAPSWPTIFILHAVCKELFLVLFYGSWAWALVVKHRENVWISLMSFSNILVCKLSA